MNDRQQATQRTLFALQSTTWAAVPQEVQPAILDALAQLLLQAQESAHNSQSNPKQELPS